MVLLHLHFVKLLRSCCSAMLLLLLTFSICEVRGTYVRCMFYTEQLQTKKKGAAFMSKMYQVSI